MTMTHYLVLTICATLFVIFLVVRRDEMRRKQRQRSVGQLDPAWEKKGKGERRRHPRHSLELPIPYERQPVEVQGPKDSKSQDIARGGVGLVVHEKLPQGCTILMHIELPGQKTKTSVLGEVVHCTEIESIEGVRRFRAGIRFWDLSRKDWEKILSHISNKNVTIERTTHQLILICLLGASLSMLALPAPAEGLFGVDEIGPAGSSRTRQKLKERRIKENRREKEIQAAYERELQEFARQREEREKRLEEAGWLEKAEGHYNREEYEEAYRLYRLLLVPTVDRPLRTKAQERLKELEENQVLSGIIHKEKREKALASLSSEDQVIRLEGVKQLGQLRDAAAAEPLVIALNDPDPFVRRVAAWSLGQIGDSVAIAPLIDALQDENVWIRDAALAALVRITGQDFGFGTEEWVNWFRGEAS